METGVRREEEEWDEELWEGRPGGGQGLACKKIKSNKKKERKYGVALIRYFFTIILKVY